MGKFVAADSQSQVFREKDALGDPPPPKVVCPETREMLSALGLKEFSKEAAAIA